jgi:Domain of unknown function (DUF4214)
VYTRVSAFSDWVRYATGYGPFAGPGPFVAGQLADFTGRSPTLASILRWTSTLARSSPSFVVRHLAAGPAWQQTAGTTDRLYRAALGRAADTRPLVDWTKRLAGGDSATRLADLLVGSGEFRARFGTLTDWAFVDHLYRSVLGTSPDPVNRVTWVRRLRAGRSRGTVLTTFAAHPAFTRRIASDAEVALVWFGMMRTAPTASQTARWRGHTDDLVHDLFATPAYLGRTWPGVNDVSADPVYDGFAASAAQTTRFATEPADWRVDGLRLPR